MARERGASRSGKKVDEYNLQEACDWVAGVTGIAQEGHLDEWLHDGVVLCTLANTLQPGVIARVNKPTMPFKMMENISAFLKAIRKMGVPDHYCFETVDLYEAKDISVVVTCLLTLKKEHLDFPLQDGVATDGGGGAGGDGGFGGDDMADDGVVRHRRRRRRRRARPPRPSR